MSYNKDLDKVLYERDIIDDVSGEKLMISINSYNGGDAKLKIGPRIYLKRNGEPGFSKVGRLSITEGVALADIIPKALEVINK